jgi:hypothetical protein
MSIATAETLTPYTVPAKERLCSLGREEIPPGAAAFADTDGWIICAGCAGHCTSCADEDCDHPQYVLAATRNPFGFDDALAAAEALREISAGHEDGAAAVLVFADLADLGNAELEALCARFGTAP